MERKDFVIFVVVASLVLGVSALSFAADTKTANSSYSLQKTGVKSVTGTNPVTRAKSNFSMLAGTVTSINTADPANTKIEIKNTADGTIHTVSVTPWTNITKVTDVSELKAGEEVRMMTRKVDDKDVAMGIMFGKMKSMPAPAAPKVLAVPQAAPAQTTTKK